MKGFAVLCAVVLLAGCGSKAVVQKWKGSEPPMTPYSGPVCLLPKPLPDGVKSVLLGRAVANQQGYGGYAKVKGALSEVARGVGANAVVDQKQKMKLFGWLAAARPQVWGLAVRVDDASGFNCEAEGGRLYLHGERLELSASSSGTPSAGYDACMARVMKITDPQLRVSSMSACDSAK